MNRSYLLCVGLALGLIGCGKGGSDTSMAPNTATNDRNVTPATASSDMQNASGVYGAKEAAPSGAMSQGTPAAGSAMTGYGTTGAGNVNAGTSTYRRTGKSMPPNYKGGGADAPVPPPPNTPQ